VLSFVNKFAVIQAVPPHQPKPAHSACSTCDQSLPPSPPRAEIEMTTARDAQRSSQHPDSGFERLARLRPQNTGDSDENDGTDEDTASLDLPPKKWSAVRPPIAASG
jgi:hypothetical protein